MILGTVVDGEYGTEITTQGPLKIMSPLVVGCEARECLPTESDKCSKLIWNADASRLEAGDH